MKKLLIITLILTQSTQLLPSAAAGSLAAATTISDAQVDVLMNALQNSSAKVDAESSIETRAKELIEWYESNIKKVMRKKFNIFLDQCIVCITQYIATDQLETMAAERTQYLGALLNYSHEIEEEFEKRISFAAQENKMCADFYEKLRSLAPQNYQAMYLLQVLDDYIKRIPSLRVRRKNRELSIEIPHIQRAPIIKVHPFAQAE